MAPVERLSSAIPSIDGLQAIGQRSGLGNDIAFGYLWSAFVLSERYQEHRERRPIVPLHDTETDTDVLICESFLANAWLGRAP